MRVKVSYGMEYEEVPALIQDLLASCQREFTLLSTKNLNTFEIVKLLEEIDEIRQKLAWVDSRLEDSSNILLGYNKTQEEADNSGGETEHPPPLPEIENDAQQK